MHAEDFDSEDSNPSFTHPGLRRARKILLLPQSTRAAKLKLQKDALRLYVSALPEELLAHIFMGFLAKTVLPPTHELHTMAKRALPTCSLVCRRWAGLAQLCLHRDVALPNAKSLLLFHRTLTSSDQFGGSVRRLLIAADARDALQLQPPAPLAQMVAGCLECTPNLEVLYLNIVPPAALTDATMQCLQLLPKLKAFYLNYACHRWLGEGAHNTSGFDPMLLRFLPSTLKDFSLKKPCLDFMEVLPQVLQLVYPSQPAAQVNMPAADASARHNSRLERLSIVSEIPGTSDAINFPALLSTTSIPATLTTLLLKLSTQDDHHELDLWYNFIGSCKQLKELDIALTRLVPSIFDSIPPLQQLQVLNIDFNCIPTQDEWESFSESFVGYAAQIPRLTDLKLATGLEGSPDGTLDRFIQDILPAFSSGDRCRLRSFSFGNPSPLTLDTIDKVNPHTLLETHFITPSIDAFELLCTRATQLEYLEIAVPLNFVPRAARAVEMLKHLNAANLHNYRLTLDPAAPLRKSDQYKHFLYCCKRLRQLLRLYPQTFAWPW